MKALAVLLCLAGPAVAQQIEDEPWIDFELLFEQNAAAVTVETEGDGEPVAVLRLPGEVRVERYGEPGSYSYNTFDCSRFGGTGEALALALSVRTDADRCPGFATPDEIARLERVLAMIGPHVARNTVPPRTWADLRPFVQALLPTEHWGACDKVLSEDSWPRALLRGMTDDETMTKLPDLLAVEKLPVMGGCR